MLPEAEPVPLRPGAGVLALEVEGEVVARLRRWIADDGRSVRIWPDDPASSDTCAPSVLLGQDSTVDQIDAWFEHRRLDDLDLPIAHATLTPSAPAQWHHAPPPGPEGAIVDGLAVLLARSIASVTPQIADDSAVLQLPGVLDGAAPTDLVQRSWHARHGGTLLRLLERPPLRREEDDRIRARWGEVHSASHPYRTHGTVFWWPGTVRWWGPGAVPGLDEPIAPTTMRPAEMLLTERLREDGTFD